MAHCHIDAVKSKGEMLYYTDNFLGSLKMGEKEPIILQGDPAILVHLSISPRAKRLTLRVSKQDGAARLSMPRFCTRAEAEKFVRAKGDWIRKHIAGHTPAQKLQFGMALPFQGRNVTLSPAQVGRVVLRDGLLLAPPAAAMLAPRVLAFYKAAARAELTGATQHYAQQLGRSYGRITLRDTRSRWGSCSAEGNLNYSWRLIMAPPAVLHYVAAHEVAHLAQMNHSPAFWNVVSNLYPEYEQQRHWLRENGNQFFTYDFATLDEV